MLVISGCASLETRDAEPLTSVSSPGIRDAGAALALGDPDSAVALLEQAASRFPEPTATGLRLESARIALELGDPAFARAALERADANASAEVRAIAALIRTRLDAERSAAAVIERLTTLPAPLSARMEPYRREALLAARAKTGDLAGALAEWRALNRAPSPASRRRAGEAQLWLALRATRTDELRAAAATATTPMAEDWLELAIGVRERALDIEATREFIARWREDRQTDTVGAATLTRISAMQRADLSPPRRVAVLLPLTGDLGGAGQAVRDGLLAAYHADSGERPELLFFDVGEAGMDAPSAYREAMAAGAGRVIGPLRKSAVRDLAASRALPVPVIALNRVESERVGGRIQQFGLAPENDARAAAALVRGAGHRRVLIIARDDDWGRRVSDAFADGFTEADGTVIARRHYPADQEDLSRPIKALLRIDASEDRRERLQSITGIRFGFEARRRQDATAVFIAAFERDARLVVPQLRFHKGIGLPVFAISASVPERPSRDARRDLSGVIFPRMPWLLDTGSGRVADRARAQFEARRAGHSVTRLEGLGVDGYRLLSGIEALARDPDLSMPGATGRLRIDAGGRIQRALHPVRIEPDGLERLPGADTGSPARLIP
mgnify:CR=1 FL=1